jgi:hypothetical protein
MNILLLIILLTLSSVFTSFIFLFFIFLPLTDNNKQPPKCIESDLDKYIFYSD